MSFRRSIATEKSVQLKDFSIVRRRLTHVEMTLIIAKEPSDRYLCRPITKLHEVGGRYGQNHIFFFDFC